MFPGWRGRDWSATPCEQVANAPDTSLNLTPVSQARADATRAGWAPLQYGQTVPRLGERVPPDPPKRGECP